jgi:hypothetical protein
MVEAPFGMLSVYHDQLYEWIEQEGYVPAGPLMEIYSAPPGGRRHVEIRVPVRRAGPADAAVAKDRPELAAMAAGGDYESLAAHVIPEADAAAPENRRWIVDIVDRLRVIREIANKKYGSDGASIVQLLNTILDRGEAIRRPPAARDRGAARSAFGGAGEKKRVILKELDSLMVKPHQKVITVEELRAELLDILEMVRDVTATPAAIRPLETKSGAADEAGGL